VETVSVANQPWPEALSEKTLIRAAQRQDHDAFEQLVRRYDRSVLRVALHLLRSEEDARDAYQEIFLRTYRSLNSFRFQCSFHTWLYRVATNVCLDFLRRKNIRTTVLPGDFEGRARGGAHGCQDDPVIPAARRAALPR